MEGAEVAQDVHLDLHACFLSTIQARRQARRRYLQACNHPSPTLSLPAAS